MVPALITASAGILGGMLNNKMQGDLALYQNTYNQEMWEKNNAYNHPKAQMARLKEAGLNPNLIYGSSANTGNSNSAPANAVTPNLVSPIGDSVARGVDTYLRTLSTYQDIKKTNQEIDESKSRETLNGMHFNQLVELIKGIKEDNLRKQQDRLYDAWKYAYEKDLAPYQKQVVLSQLRAMSMKLLMDEQSYNYYKELNPLLITEQKYKNSGLFYDLRPKKYRYNMIERNGYDPVLGPVQGGLSVIADGINKGVDSLKRFGNKAAGFFKGIYDNWTPDKKVYHPY